MEEELDKTQVKSDLEKWNKLLGEAIISLNDAYIKLEFLNQRFQTLYEQVNKR